MIWFGTVYPQNCWISCKFNCSVRGVSKLLSSWSGFSVLYLALWLVDVISVYLGRGGARRGGIVR
jgi:hypothetical protein